MYATIRDPADLSQWAGLTGAVGRALSERHDVATVGPIAPSVTSMSRRWAKAIDRRAQRSGRHYPIHADTPGIGVATLYGALLRQRLRHERFDAVVVAGDAALLAMMRPARPTVLVADSTFATLLDYLPRYTNMVTTARATRAWLAQRAMASFDAFLFSSAWAAQSAIDNYGLHPERVHVAAFGPVTVDPRPIERAVPPPFKALFVGRSWDNKGGRLTVDTVRQLRAAGLDITLTTVGSGPVTTENGWQGLGYLDPNDATNRERLRALFEEHHIAVLPTVADCSPNVLIEAAAAGMPAVTTRVGGIPELVDDGHNGKLVPTTAAAAELAGAIRALCAPDAYAAAARAARAVYAERLGWHRWHEGMSRALETARRSRRD